MNAFAVADADGFTVANRGVRSQAQVQSQNEVDFNYAVEASTTIQANSDVNINVGVSGLANHLGTGTYNYGGYFEGWSPGGVTAGYGIFATSAGASTNYAGYFSGDVYCTGSYLPSDASLKTGVIEANGQAMQDALSTLTVHQYEYNTAQFPRMNLPEGSQVGLLAEELESIIPGLVKTSIHPAQFDAEGNQVSESVSYKAVNYAGLIPYLIAGHQAQQQEMAALRAEMEQLREQLAGCCGEPGGERMGPVPANGSDEGMLTPAQDRLLRIAPNPFTDRTTLYYTVERSGRMQLLANSADGRDLRVLSEARREAGEYQYEWDTTALAQGVYYITLLLDGEPVVKKAVKVGR